MIITILGEPQGKARARVVRNKYTGKNHSFTPEKTELYENLIKLEYKNQGGEYFGFSDGSKIKKNVSVVIRAYYGIPQSFSKKKKTLAESNSIRPSKKPDADNIAKVVCDALNGIAYIDDTQVVSLSVSKYYSDIPRVEIEAQEIKGGRL